MSLRERTGNTFERNEIEVDKNVSKEDKNGGGKSYLREVVVFSILSRVVYIFIMATTAFINPVYDLSQETVIPLASETVTLTSSSLKLRHNDILASFSTWDSHHYATISDLGYIYEHQYAFHPFYPFLTRVLGGTVETKFLYPLFKKSLLF